MPRWLGGGEFSLNPGPWNIKEHALVYIMANVSIGVPTALNAVVVAEVYYGVKLGYGFNAMLILTTQLTGFSLAGLCRRYLVWPASMVWPQNLIVCTLLNTLHAEEEEARGGISRFRFFCYAGVGAFFWFFVPGASPRPISRGRSTEKPPQATSSPRCLSSRSCAGFGRRTSSSTSSSASLAGWA